MCILYVNKNVDIKLNAQDTYNTQQNTVFKMVNISTKSCLWKKRVAYKKTGLFKERDYHNSCKHFRVQRKSKQ